MLLLGDCQVNGLAVDERKLAMNDGWTDGARDGSEHLIATVYMRALRGEEALKEVKSQNRL